MTFKSFAQAALRSPRWLVLLAPFVLVAPIWLTGRALYWGTPATQFVPWWWHAWQTLRTGDLPLWNPLLGMGAPLAANYQSAIFYPPTWIYFIFAAIGGLPLMAWGQSLLLAAHLAWAGWGMLSLLRRLKLGEFAQTIGALAFSLSGYLVARAHFLSINATVAWLPWILLAAYELALDRTKTKAVIKLGFFLGMQWLAGHAQISWYTLLLTVAWFVFWVIRASGWSGIFRKLVPFAAAFALAFGLSAIQLIPTAEYLLQSQRSAGVDVASVMFSSFWPWRFIGFLAPNFFGNPGTGDFSGYANYWEDAIYIGLIPFGLALIALGNLRAKKNLRPFTLFLVGLILISFLLALGEKTPIFPWLFSHVPTFDMFKAPTRFSLWAIFALSLLAAFAAESWKPVATKKLYWQRIAVAAAFSLLLALVLAYALSSLGILQIPLAYVTALSSAGLVALAVVILNLLTRMGKINAHQFKMLVCILVAVDLVYAGWGLNPAGPIEIYNEGPAVSSSVSGGRLYLSSADEDQLKYGYFFRPATFFSGDALALGTTLLPNTNLLDQISSVNNYDPILPARYVDWINALSQANSSMKSEILAAMNVTISEQLLAGKFPIVSFTPVASLPRAYWVNCANVVATAAQARSIATSGEIDFADQTVVEMMGRNDGLVCGSSEIGSATLGETSANRVQVSVDAPGGGWLVLADTWYPGWQAFANGEQLEIYPALGVFRAVQLPAGQYDVDFVYSPSSFLVGSLLSLVALSLLGFLWWRTQNHEPTHV